MGDAVPVDDRARHITRAGLLLAAELVRVTRALEARGIAVVVLKGAPLARRLGLTLAAREFGDNDLLVRKRDVRAAAAELEALGYRRHQRRTVELALRTDTQVTLTRLHEGARLAVDLHWSPFVRIHPVPEDLVWDRTELMIFERTRLRVLDPALTLIHLAAHFEQHAFCEPRNLKDVAVAWNTWAPTLDTRELLDLAASLGLQHCLAFALSTAAELGWLEVAPPPVASARAELLRHLLPAASLKESRPLGHLGRGVASLLLAEPRQAGRELMRALAPPIEVLAAIYDQPPSWRLAPRYLTRPFRPLARLLGWTPPR